MTLSLDITCERPLLDLTETANDYYQISPTYDYGIINFVKPIEKFIAVPEGQGNDSDFNSLNMISDKIDTLFSELLSKGSVNIPTGLHSALDRAIESQSNKPSDFNISGWANKISNEIFGE